SGVQPRRSADLLELRFARCHVRRLSRLGKRPQKQCHGDADDADHDQQLDQREAAAMVLWLNRLTRHELEYPSFQTTSVGTERVVPPVQPIPGRSVPEREIRLKNSERSEEHTSELQSRGHLVCRLLLE